MNESSKKPIRREPPEGVTLEMMVEALVANYGWDRLGEKIRIKCFTENPSIKSSLKFLRKTPWARQRVEAWFLYEQRRRLDEKTESGPTS